MSQKSILSFFKTSNTSAPSDSEIPNASEAEETSAKKSLKSDNVESPVKKVRKKRKADFVESDEDSSPTKISNGGLEQNGESEETSNKSPKTVSNGEIEDVKINGTPRRPTKMKKLENGEEEASSKSPEKMEIDSCVADESTPTSSKVGTPSSAVTTPSSTTLGNELEYTPRRKTARKTLTPFRKTEGTSSINKEKISSVVENDESSSNHITTGDESKNKTPVPDIQMSEKNSLTGSQDDKENQKVEGDLKDTSSVNKEKIECEVENVESKNNTPSPDIQKSENDGLNGCQDNTENKKAEGSLDVKSDKLKEEDKPMYFRSEKLKEDKPFDNGFEISKCPSVGKREIETVDLCENDEPSYNPNTTNDESENETRSPNIQMSEYDALNGCQDDKENEKAEEARKVETIDLCDNDEPSYNPITTDDKSKNKVSSSNLQMSDKNALSKTQDDKDNEKAGEERKAETIDLCENDEPNCNPITTDDKSKNDISSSDQQMDDKNTLNGSQSEKAEGSQEDAEIHKLKKAEDESLIAEFSDVEGVETVDLCESDEPSSNPISTDDESKHETPVSCIQMSEKDALNRSDDHKEKAKGGQEDTSSIIEEKMDCEVENDEASCSSSNMQNDEIKISQDNIENEKAKDLEESKHIKDDKINRKNDFFDIEKKDLPREECEKVEAVDVCESDNASCNLNLDQNSEVSKDIGSSSDSKNEKQYKTFLVSKNSPKSKQNSRKKKQGKQKSKNGQSSDEDSEKEQEDKESSKRQSKINEDQERNSNEGKQNSGKKAQKRQKTRNEKSDDDDNSEKECEDEGAKDKKSCERQSKTNENEDKEPGSSKSEQNSEKTQEKQKTQNRKSDDEESDKEHDEDKKPKDKKGSKRQSSKVDKAPKSKAVKVETGTAKKMPLKRKMKPSPKKETPTKKPAMQNSIQKFFAPIKKPEVKVMANDSDAKELGNIVKGDTEEKAESKQVEDTKVQAESMEVQDEAKEELDESMEVQDETKKELHESMEVKDETTKKELDESMTVQDVAKKGQDKNCESKTLETGDSPVKKVKGKRKRQALDSDEDEEEPKVVLPIKKVEVDKSKAETPSEETPMDSSKVKELPSDCKISPSKKEPEPSSKSTTSKQAFGCKSTSSGTVYDPSKARYHPIDDACWKKDEKVPYLALAKTLELIENTSGRLKIIEILSNFYRSVIVLSPDDLLQSVYLCLNRLAPEYEGIELGVGETLLMKAVAQATGRTLAQIKAEVAVKGDLGLVSESSRGNQRVMFAPPKLTVSSVFSKFLEIAKMTGNASMSKKTDKIQSLCVACRDCESKYIIRSLSGKLRIGLAEQSILTAIARAAVLTPPSKSYPPEVIDASKGMSENKFKEFLDSQTLIVKTAYCETSNYDLIIPVLLKEGISALPKSCQLEPGRPLKPMLAHPTDGIDKILERFDKNAFTCEFKYDGERAQIHMTEKGEVKIFSRNQEDNTTKYPDVISRITKTLKETTKSFILDSEAVAWDKSLKQILPFQVLSTRKKKDAVESEIVVQVCIMAFDLLYLNGESLVKKPLKERRSLLHSAFNEVENEFMFAQHRDGDSAETMQEFLDESVKGNCEGLMVKALETDASYEIAKRSHNWLKLKKDYLQGIGDTLDLVVIGGYFGKGKRTGNYGGFLLACYDEENEEFQSICKLGTGFKDDILEMHTTFLKQHVIDNPKSYYRYDHSLQPDVWFDAVQVWEIKCADLSISPIHKAAIGIVDPEKGISLRFPRFVRIRDDKTPENATNSVQIADMYQKQSQIQNTTNKNTKTDEDYY